MAEECRSCGASIDWAVKFPEEIGRNGRPKTTPVDRGSADDPKGNLAIWRDEGGATLECGCYLRAAEVRAVTVNTVTLHSKLACPNCAASFRITRIHPKTGVLHFRYLTKKSPELKPGEHRGVSHFATCPDRKEWNQERDRP